MTETDPRPQTVKFIEEERICIFCEQPVNDGVALQGNLMKLAECADNEWGHLECYLTYAVHHTISGAHDYILEGLKEKFEEWITQYQSSENAK